MTLIELLIAMMIMAIITAMTLVVWFALNDSYHYSVYSATIRDNARQAMTRMEREVRDGENPPAAVSETTVIRARQYWIQFYTTFNNVGNQSYAQDPVLIAYRLYRNPTTKKYEVWRFEDTNASGTITGFNTNPGADDPTGWSYSETASAEATGRLVSNVVNFGSAPAPQRDLFTYNYIDTDGSYHSGSPVFTRDERQKIIGVRIRLLVDMNPQKAPVYADMSATAQIRNQRAL